MKAVAKQAVCLLLIFTPLLGHTNRLDVQLVNGPTQGEVVFQFYRSGDGFGELRNPVVAVRRAVSDASQYSIDDVPVGELALVVYHDENRNGLLDRNFIGIPKEPLALSNNYRPKGPPSFERAKFVMSANETLSMTLDMYQLLGRRGGRWGVGIGAIGQSSPYVDSDTNPTAVFPAVAYIGERLQWFGPSLQYGLVGSGGIRLAVIANFRIGSYDEDDSPALAGLGDRDNTLLAGLAVRFDLPVGFLLSVGYQQDVLDQIGGGEGNITLSRGIQLGKLRLSPQASWNWTSSQLSQHDFGVPIAAATPTRTAFDLGSTNNFGVGLSASYELTEAWRINLNVNVEELDSAISESPIVDEDRLVNGFFTLTYSF